MNIILEEITDSGNPRLETIIELYEEAFPRRERRETEDLKKMAAGSDMRLFAINSGEDTAGFIIVWELGDFTFIEHFAILGIMRGSGIGKAVMDKIVERFAGKMVFEVEPAEDEISCRRVEFYRRAGFEVLTENYIQPPYREEDSPARMWLMSNIPCREDIHIDEYIRMIHEKVYEV